MHQGIRVQYSDLQKRILIIPVVHCKYIYTPLIITLSTIAVAKYRVFNRRDDFANR